mgnify:CR=1 FL=1|tara:strand:- start:453 stop:1502 length:1050 start_codon:yes stop_codon:yes gene_type:complete
MRISTPGRICLFGEHQDYLGLPVISMAVSLRSIIEGDKRTDNQIIIHKRDLNETENFSLDNLEYLHPRDYFKSGIKVCQNAGLTFSNGFECEITSDIPIQAGVSSSSAIVVSWIHFLSKIADQNLQWDKKRIGELAYQSEVIEFNEPGGLMDQYTTALGQLIYLESKPSISINTLNVKLGTFVLGDSGKTKDTLNILKRAHHSRLALFKKLKLKNPNNTIYNFNSNADTTDLNNEEIELFNATIINRDLLNRALTELNKKKPNRNLIGRLLLDHHQILDELLKVSTPQINAMLDAAISAGALGGKINGSGGGGCMFAYAPNNPKKVAKAIESVGGKAYIVQMDKGTFVE